LTLRFFKLRLRARDRIRKLLHFLSQRLLICILRVKRQRRPKQYQQ